ncbi:uncharacterized protein RBU57_009865 [Macrochelys suwanniensis]
MSARAFGQDACTTDSGYTGAIESGAADDAGTSPVNSESSRPVANRPWYVRCRTRRSANISLDLDTAHLLGAGCTRGIAPGRPPDTVDGTTIPGTAPGPAAGRSVDPRTIDLATARRGRAPGTETAVGTDPGPGTDPRGHGTARLRGPALKDTLLRLGPPARPLGLVVPTIRIRATWSRARATGQTRARIRLKPRCSDLSGLRWRTISPKGPPPEPPSRLIRSPGHRRRWCHALLRRPQALQPRHRPRSQTRSFSARGTLSGPRNHHTRPSELPNLDGSQLPQPPRSHGVLHVRDHSCQITPLSTPAWLSSVYHPRRDSLDLVLTVPSQVLASLNWWLDPKKVLEGVPFHLAASVVNEAGVKDLCTDENDIDRTGTKKDASRD